MDLGLLVTKVMRRRGRHPGGGSQRTLGRALPMQHCGDSRSPLGLQSHPSPLAPPSPLPLQLSHSPPHFGLYAVLVFGVMRSSVAVRANADHIPRMIRSFVCDP